MECVHKVLAYPHLVDFFIFFCTFFKSKVFVYERPAESNKASRLLLFPDCLAPQVSNANNPISPV